LKSGQEEPILVSVAKLTEGMEVKLHAFITPTPFTGELRDASSFKLYPQSNRID
jgi:hypothetical protein